jgi:hypothetical protein
MLLPLPLTEAVGLALTSSSPQLGENESNRAASRRAGPRAAAAGTLHRRSAMRPEGRPARRARRRQAQQRRPKRTDRQRKGGAMSCRRCCLVKLSLWPSAYSNLWPEINRMMGSPSTGMTGMMSVPLRPLRWGQDNAAHARRLGVGLDRRSAMPKHQAPAAGQKWGGLGLNVPGAPNPKVCPWMCGQLRHWPLLGLTVGQRGQLALHAASAWRSRRSPGRQQRCWLAVSDGRRERLLSRVSRAELCLCTLHCGPGTLHCIRQGRAVVVV